MRFCHAFPCLPAVQSPHYHSPLVPLVCLPPPVPSSVVHVQSAVSSSLIMLASSRLSSASAKAALVATTRRYARQHASAAAARARARYHVLLLGGNLSRPLQRPLALLRCFATQPQHSEDVQISSLESATTTAFASSSSSPPQPPPPPPSQPPSNSPNEEAKISMLKTITQAAELDIKRMLALSDELFQEQEEEEHRRKQQEEQKYPHNNGANSRQRGRQRQSLRERVERETERRRMEHSHSGMADRRLRLERRRKYWEAKHRQEMEQQEGSAHKVEKQAGKKKKGGADVVEGLGLPTAPPASSAAAFVAEQDAGAWNDTEDNVVTEEKSGGDLLSLLRDGGKTDGESTTFSTADAKPDSHSLDADTFDETDMSDTSLVTPDSSAKSISSTKEEAVGKSEYQPPASTTPAPSLMGLLDDTPSSSFDADGAHVDTSSETFDGLSDTTHYTDSSSVSKSDKKPTLMELLDDDSIFTSYDSARQQKPLGTHFEENNHKSSGLDSIISSSRNEPADQPTSLMDLLNENFSAPHQDKKENGAFRGADVVHDSYETQQQGSLMDLLNENFSSSGESTSSSAFHKSVTSESRTSFFESEAVIDEPVQSDSLGNSSLMDLLDDESVDTGTSITSVDSADLASDTMGGSLLDLLDDDDEKGSDKDPLSIDDNESPKTSLGVSESGDTSLLDLLDDSGPSDSVVDEENASSSLSGAANDLLSLLDDDGDEESASLSIDNSDSSYLSFSDNDEEGDSALDEFGASGFGAIDNSLFGDNREDETMAAIVDELLALLISASRKEWNDLQNEKGDGSITSDSDVAAEVSFSELNTEPYSNDVDKEKPLVDASALVRSLLEGSLAHHWSLTSDELNLILLHLATLNPTHHTMNLMIRIHKFMEDCRLRGHATSVPNAATYSILMTAFGMRGLDFQAAAFVCKRMMETMEANTSSETNDVKQATSKFHIDQDALDIGVRALKRCDDAKAIEKLLSLALGEAGAGVDVRMSVYTNLLMLYKEDNMQKEALELMDICIQDKGVGDNARRLDRFIKSLVRWPKTNRQGNRIATASFCDEILEYLEDHCDDNDFLDEYEEKYRPAWFVWRELLVALSRSARTESKGQYESVRRACRGLFTSSKGNSHPDHFVLKLGLEAAEALGDAKLAADLIAWSWQSAQHFIEPPSQSPSSSPFDQDTYFGGQDLENDFDSLFGLGTDKETEDMNVVGDEESGSSDLLSLLDSDTDEADNSNRPSQSDKDKDAVIASDINTWSLSEHPDGPPKDFIHIPVKAYYQAIKLCLAQGNTSLAHSILFNGCSSADADSRFPESSRSHLYTLVMAGYAQRGDFDEAQSLLTEMQNSGPRPTEHTYAAYIHALAMANKFDEASNVVDSMITDEYSDGVKPQSSCFSACMISALKAKEYQMVLDLNRRMTDAGVKPNQQSYFGVMLASTRMGDRDSALQAAELALESKLPMNLDGFNLVCKILLPDCSGNGSIDSIRKNLRKLGLDRSDLTADANKLSRSLRMAEMEEKRPKRTKDVRKCEELWHESLEHLCMLVHKVDGF